MVGKIESVRAGRFYELSLRYNQKSELISIGLHHKDVGYLGSIKLRDSVTRAFSIAKHAPNWN